MDIAYDGVMLPVLYRCEVAVIDGSFGGVTAALKLARAGRQVVLVESRTYLGREVTATLRPWIRMPDGADRTALPEVVSACIQASGMPAANGEVPLYMGQVKTRLEDLLLAAGVRLVYASVPVGLCSEEGRVRGVVIGNKSGRQVIACEVVLDASATALVARLAGAVFDPPPSESVFSCTLEFTSVGALEGRVLAVPERLGLVGNRLTRHAGYRARGHVLLEYQLALPGPGDDPLAIARRESAARRKMADLAEYLMGSVPAFDGAYPAETSYELHGPHTHPMSGPIPEWASALQSATVTAREEDGEELQVPVSRFAAPLMGVWCLNEAVRLDGAMRAQLRDPISSCGLGDGLARVLDVHWKRASAAGEGGVPVTERPSPLAPGREDFQVKEPESPQRGRGYEPFSVPPLKVPVLRAADVIVVGGGSSGAVAGIIAGQEGMRTVLVDMNPGLGGTGTYGGIYTYWFARRIGFVDKLMGWVDEAHDRLQLPRPKGVMARWNILAKTWVMMDKAEDAGVELLMNAYVIATIVQDSTVRGVVLATRVGPVALLGQVVIDATGDGDVAAFAGADYVYGSKREHALQYAYMPQIIEPGRPRNVKTSMLDVRNVEDYTRMILAERRRVREGDHDQGVYLAPRESRHITADVVLTLTDQLVLRCWPDVAYIAFSNYDMKGPSDSDWLRMGLQSPNLEIEIPYRALLPKDVENILVVGKAFSATHDAQAAPRMQPDLENLGGAAAVAAAMAVRSGEAPRNIDVRALQTRLVEVGALPEHVLSRTLEPLQYTDEELEALIDSVDADRSLLSFSDQEIGELYEGRVPLVDAMCAGPQVVPVLEQALAKAEGPRQLLLARALATLGSPAGVPVLVSAIQDQLEGDQLPRQENVARHAGKPPNQHSAPDVASLIYSLCLARDRRALPIWQRVVELLASTTADDIVDRNKAQYYYVDVVCYGAERLGDPAAIPILTKLHSYAPFRNQMTVSGFQPDWFKERLAYLELVIGRALARCGSPDGFVILINYLRDVRALLAEHAHSELIAITGQDLGKNVAAWSQWLESEGDSLEPVPWVGPSDPVLAWDDVILTMASEDDTTE